MNENLTMETNEMENYEVMDLEDEGSGNGLGVAIAVGTVLVAAAGAAVVFKDKIKALNTKRRIDKLTKAGFVVLGPTEDVVEAEVVEDIEE